MPPPRKRPDIEQTREALRRHDEQLGDAGDDEDEEEAAPRADEGEDEDEDEEE